MDYPPVELPPGWSIATDPSSDRSYYYHQSSGETSWYPPPPPAPPAARPPIIRPPRTAAAAASTDWSAPHNDARFVADPYVRQQQEMAPQQHFSDPQQEYASSSSVPHEQEYASHHMPAHAQQEPHPSLLNSSRMATTTQPTPVSHQAQHQSTTLVGTARILLDEQGTCQSSKPDHELASFSAGRVADLVHLQREQQSGNSSYSYYVPLDPHHLLNVEAERPVQEVSRIETRLHALHEQLRRI